MSDSSNSTKIGFRIVAGKMSRNFTQDIALRPKIKNPSEHIMVVKKITRLLRIDIFRNQDEYLTEEDDF